MPDDEVPTSREERTEEHAHCESPSTVETPSEPRSESKHSSAEVTTSLTMVSRQSLIGVYQVSLAPRKRDAS